MFDVTDYPTEAQRHFWSGAPNWPFAVQAAEGTEADDLADLVFFMHHPERMKGPLGRPLRKGEPRFKALAAEWKTWRAAALAVLDQTDTRRPRSRPRPRKTAATIDDVRRELDRLAADGEITEVERTVAEALAEEILGGAGQVVSAANFAASVVSLVKDLPTTGILGTAAGILGFIGPFLQFAGFVLALDRAMDSDIRVYRGVAAAYGVTAWVFDERTPNRCRKVRDRIGGGRRLDSNWNDAARKARRHIAEQASDVGTDHLRTVLQPLGRRRLVRLVLEELASSNRLDDPQVGIALGHLADENLGYPK